MRLSPKEGAVEIYYGGAWATINYVNIWGANVICRELGLNGLAAVLRMEPSGARCSEHECLHLYCYGHEETVSYCKIYIGVSVRNDISHLSCGRAHAGSEGGPC